jgi:hypothetical protein
MLPQNEGRAACRAALLSVGVSEERSLFRKPVNVGGSVAHYSEIVGTDVMNADVVTPNNENVRLILFRAGGWRSCQPQNREKHSNNQSSLSDPLHEHLSSFSHTWQKTMQLIPSTYSATQPHKLADTVPRTRDE